MIECMRRARTKPTLAVLCMQYGVRKAAQDLKDAGVPLLFSRFGLSENAGSLAGTLLAYFPKVPAILLTMCLMDRVGRRALLVKLAQEGPVERRRAP